MGIPMGIPFVVATGQKLEITQPRRRFAVKQRKGLPIAKLITILTLPSIYRLYYNNIYSIILIKSCRRKKNSSILYCDCVQKQTKEGCLIYY